MNPTTTDTLHDALERLAAYAWFDGAGFACHGPMGAEALIAMGRDDAVAGWVEAYKAAHPPIDAPPPRERLDPNDEGSWRPALGDPARLTDWWAAFTEQLWDAPWEDVLRRWVPVLLPGSAGGLGHGLLRTGHVVRALHGTKPPSRLLVGELARGLALWAALHRALPASATLRGRRTLDEAVDALPRPAQPWSPIEAGTFSRLGELDGFAGAVDALEAPADQHGALGALTAAFCGVLLDHPDAELTGLVHAVTPVGAARTLAPYAPDVAPGALYAGLWTLGAAVVVGFSRPGRAVAWREAEPPDEDDLVDRATTSIDPHPVKFVEACLREHRLRPDTVYPHAARLVLDRSEA